MSRVATLKVSISSWMRDARANPLFARGLVIAVIALALDRLSKYWIVHIVELPTRRKIELSPVFDLTYVCNKGVSFGLLAGGMASRIFLSFLSIVIAGVVIAWLGRIGRPIVAIAAGLILGGAVGNLFDRASQGCVVDFLDFSGLMFPWVFNVADAAINIGFACLILDALTHKSSPPPAD